MRSMKRGAGFDVVKNYVFLLKKGSYSSISSSSHI